MRETQELLAHAAHIVARSNAGPRAEPDLPMDERDADVNLILLCPNHHALIDSPSGVKRWNRDALLRMKEAHEQWVLKRLSIGSPIECDLSLLAYLNVPRLAALALLVGQRIDLRTYEGPELLLDRGIFTSNLMDSFESILERIALRGTPLSKVDLMNQDSVGLTVTFDGTFYPKNVPFPGDVRTGKFQFSGKLNIDPHIYRTVGDARLVLPIDPKWILSMTGWGDFGDAPVRFAGACTIRRIHVAKRIIVASPLFLGTPRSKNDRMFVV